MAKLAFYGGIDEIGGNKILLSDGDTRIFIDFGENFEKERQFFDEPYLAPREEKHLLSLGILPDLPGLYKSDQEETSINAVLLSHPHVDHTDYVRYIKPDINICCDEITKTMIVAREFSSRHPSEYAIAKLTKTSGEEIFNKFQEISVGRSEKIDSVEIEPVEVDHSTLGACGFLIHTSEGCVVYTGDFRLHGPLRGASEKFIKTAQELRPEALIIEGTNIADAGMTSENEVKEKIDKLVSVTPRLTMVSLSSIDIHRLKTLYDVAKKNNRTLGVSMKQAFLLDALNTACKSSIIDLHDPDICIFQRQKKRLDEWENRICTKYSNVKQCEELSKIQDNLILVASFYDMNEMCDLKPKTGSNFILSQSEPFNEEMEIDHKKLLNWLEHYGLPLYNIHASGHAYPHDLKEAIATISPQKVFLVHTERPKLYRKYIEDLKINTVCPELAKEYPIK